MTDYDADFYGWQADGSAASAAAVAPILDELIAPRTVLDVGCGLGTWAARWPGATGVDGAWVLDNKLAIARENFVAHDLREPLNLNRRYDMALCLEAGEHLPRGAAQVLVDSLCRHSDIVVFSAAVPGQGGIGHLNERWPSWWARLFARNGYQPYDLLRGRIWWDQRIEWWYRQNMLVFARSETATRRGWLTPQRSIDLAQPALLMPELRPRLQATVCIPWRPSPSRLAPFARVCQYWESFGWPVITADSDTDIFSLAQARNNAVEKATTDVVIITDADTIIDPLNVCRAVAEPVGVCWPFTKYRILSAKYLRTPLAELVDVPYINTWDGQGALGVGGCLIATTAEYWRVGGQPAQFIGWGWEDTAFTAVVQTLSRVRRLTGCVYAFEHNTDADGYVGGRADSPGWDRDVARNQQLMAPYSTANGRPWLMREIIRQQQQEKRHGRQTRTT